MDKYELVIVGGGPVGMYASYYGAMRGLKIALVDSLSDLGGQLAQLYPEKKIYDIPGFKELKAIDLVENIKGQMDKFKENIDIYTNETVDYLHKRDDRIFEICTNNTCFYAQSVLITSGKGAFFPRTLGFENEKEYTNINYAITNIADYKGKKVVIFGGGDSAVDWANMLDGIAESVTLVHRRDTFRAHEQSVNALRETNAKIITSYTAKELVGSDGKVEKVIIGNKENETIELEVDNVLVFFGHISALGPVEEWELELEKKSLKVNPSQQTSVSGVYAAGDSCLYEGKVKIITAGFGEAATAVTNIYQYVHGKRGKIFSSTIKQ